MTDFLKNLVKSKTFKAVVALLAAALTAYATQGCNLLQSKVEHPSVAVLACKIAVLAPYVGDAAAEVAREFDGNRAFDPAAFLLAQGLSVPEVLAIAKAYTACTPSSGSTELPADVEKSLTPS
jgi:hypothetical protein